MRLKLRFIEVIGCSFVDGWVLVIYVCDGLCCFFFFKQKTAYEIGTGDWSSDVCSSDLNIVAGSGNQ